MARRTTRRTGDSGIGVAYIRVSKDDQKLSPEAQAKAIERYATAHGIALVVTALDLGVCSADTADERPGLSLALDAMKDYGAGVLLVAKRDRLSRDVFVTLSVERVLSQGGAVLVSASGEGNGDTSSDQLQRGVHDLFAQHERARIRERTKAALSVIRSHGRKTGGDVPYGFTVAADGRTLVAVKGEQAIVRKARELRAMGVSLPKISAMLAAEGHVGRTGRPLHPMQVSRMTA